ncbi:MAG: PilZ domain-containing protein [Elusimicrobia bacterium]|nr:PilZ domain-containing protein [Elusimicrobiota bacterium]
MKLSRLLDKARKRFKAPSADPSASAQDALDRRRSVRSRLDCTVELLDAARRPADGAVHLIDMSSVGVGFASSRDFKIGDAMGVSFNSGGRTVNTTGRVRWARPAGNRTLYGLEFEAVGTLDRVRLATASSPLPMDPEDAINLLLSVGAAVMACSVAADWMFSEPSRQLAFFAFLPYFALLGVAALIVFLIARQI